MVQTMCYINGQEAYYRGFPNQGWPLACPITGSGYKSMLICENSINSDWRAITRGPYNTGTAILADEFSYSSSQWGYVGSRIVGTVDADS
jgi:hypothetical protein